jgi:hypothetical protein
MVSQPLGADAGVERREADASGFRSPTNLIKAGPLAEADRPRSQSQTIGARRCAPSHRATFYARRVCNWCRPNGSADRWLGVQQQFGANLR